MLEESNRIFFCGVFSANLTILGGDSVFSRKNIFFEPPYWSCLASGFKFVQTPLSFPVGVPLLTQPMFRSSGSWRARTSGGGATKPLKKSEAALALGWLPFKPQQPPTNLPLFYCFYCALHFNYYVSNGMAGSGAQDQGVTCQLLSSVETCGSSATPSHSYVGDESRSIRIFTKAWSSETKPIVWWRSLILSYF